MLAERGFSPKNINIPRIELGSARVNSWFGKTAERIAIKAIDRYEVVLFGNGITPHTAPNVRRAIEKGGLPAGWSELIFTVTKMSLTKYHKAGLNLPRPERNELIKRLNAGTLVRTLPEAFIRTVGGKVGERLLNSVFATTNNEFWPSSKRRPPISPERAREIVTEEWEKVKREERAKQNGHN